MSGYGRVQAATLISEILRRPIFRIDNGSAVLDVPRDTLIVDRAVADKSCGFIFDKYYRSSLIEPFILVSENGISIQPTMNVRLREYDTADTGTLAFRRVEGDNKQPVNASSSAGKVVRYQDISNKDIIYPRNMSYEYDSPNTGYRPTPSIQDPSCATVRMYTTVGDRGTGTFTALDNSAARLPTSGPLFMPINRMPITPRDAIPSTSRDFPITSAVADVASGIVNETTAVTAALAKTAASMVEGVVDAAMR